VPFLCVETHELGEEIVASFLYQVHLYTGSIKRPQRRLADDDCSPRPLHSAYDPNLAFVAARRKISSSPRTAELQSLLDGARVLILCSPRLQAGMCLHLRCRPEGRR